MENLNWNEKFKVFCVAKGLSQADVVELTGVSIVTVRHWYQGTRPVSEQHRLILIEKLGLNESILEDGEISIYSLFDKKMAWNNKLKAYCCAKGWTLDDVSKLTGLSKMLISLWFRGVRRPTDNKKMILVEKLGIDISIFYEELE